MRPDYPLWQNNSSKPNGTEAATGNYGSDPLCARESSHYVMAFQQVLLEIIQPTVIVLGIVGNVLNLLILIRRVPLTGRCTNSAMTLLFWMSVNDLVVLTIQLPSFGNTENAYYKCKVRYPLSNFFLTAIAILSATVAVDRFAAIKSVAALQRFFTEHARKLVAGIMAFALAYNIPRYFEFEVHDCGDRGVCMRTKFAVDTMTFLPAIGGFVNSIVPMLVLVTFGGIVIISFVQIRSEHQKLFASSSLSQREREANSRISLASRMVVATIILFAICTATSVLLVMLNLIGFNWRSTDWGIVLMSLNNFFTLAKSSVNFILYCSTCSMYRAAVRELLFAHCKNAKKINGNDGSPTAVREGCTMATKTGESQHAPAAVVEESILLKNDCNADTSDAPNTV